MPVIARRTLTLFFLLLSLSVLSATPAMAKDFNIESVLIEATVRPDGSMLIKESRTLLFDGEFHWAQIKVDKAGSDGIKGFSVHDAADGKPYFQDYSEEPGTFQLADTADSLTAKWFYEAASESRTFVFTYTVLGAVKAYDDAAQLYWKFIGDESEKGADAATIVIHLPAGAGKADIKAWAHGPLQGNVAIAPDGTVNLKVADLPAKTFVEGRVLMPLRLVPKAPRVPGKIVDKVLDEERGWAATANRKRLVAKGLVFGAPVLAGLALLLGVFWFFRYGKELKPDFDGDYFRELPGEYPPAMMGFLWRFGKADAQDLSSTVMDLARRGYMKIETRTVEKKKFLHTDTEEDYFLIDSGKDRSGLEDYESDLLALIFDDVAEGKAETSIHAMMEYARTNKVAFKKTFDAWKAKVEKAGAKLKFGDDRSESFQVYNGCLGGFVAIASFFLMSKALFAGLTVLTLSVLQLVLTPLIKRRSQKGVNDFARWQAFRRFLVDFSNLDDAPLESMVIWEHYLVYAVGLGVADRVVDNLRRAFPNYADPNSPSYYRGPAWFVMGDMGRDGFSGFNDLSTSFNQMAVAATSAASSGSGGGGGFSGGGGGGGGGGGFSAG